MKTSAYSELPLLSPGAATSRLLSQQRSQVQASPWDTVGMCGDSTATTRSSSGSTEPGVGVAKSTGFRQPPLHGGRV